MWLVRAWPNAEQSRSEQRADEMRGEKTRDVMEGRVEQVLTLSNTPVLRESWLAPIRAAEGYRPRSWWLRRRTAA